MEVPVSAELANHGWTDMLDFRITIFSLAACPHCKRAKAHLTEQGYEYYEVSLTDYPEKRDDMVAISNRLTVPQIFLNEKHIGGAAELDHLIDSRKLDSVVAEVKATARTRDPRLECPNYPPKQEVAAIPVAETCITIGEQCMQHSEIVDILQSKLTLADRRYKGVTHRRCFRGSEAVDLFLGEFKLRSRAEAVQVGDSLCLSQIFHHVTGEEPFGDNSHLFRLQLHANPTALNTWKVWKDSVDDPFVSLKHAKAVFSQLQASHMDSDGRTDYVALSKDAQYQAFKERVCELQQAHLSTLSPQHRKAFFINLYNLVVLHAFAEVGIPQTDLRRYAFFDQVGYQIEGHFFSLNDMENGILRANKTAPYHLNRPFSQNDPRLQFALPECDNRVHWALNCGAASCPPIKDFSPEAVDEELRVAALAFFEEQEHAAFDDKKKTLSVTKIVSWYRSDFGDTDLEVAQTLLPWLPRKLQERVQGAMAEAGSVRVRYQPYDWSTSASLHKDYNPAELKTQKKRCCVVM